MLIGGAAGGLTVSLGVASRGEEATTSAALLARADHALHEAKRQGKNRVVVAGRSARAPG